MPRIWDIHVHFPFRRGGPRDPRLGQDDPSLAETPDPQAALDHLAERLREVGVIKASLLCPNRPAFATPPGAGAAPVPPLTHESCIEMAAKHADLFAPHAVVDPEVVTYERTHELHDMGYKGLKIIGTRRPYDVRDYFPVYRAAEESGMPILFHCGVIGGGIDWLTRHPRRNPESAKRLREQDNPSPEQQARPQQARGGRPTSATYMRPFHLETIANRFPRLKIIGAHLGGTGNYDEAASVARWRRWVYFDMSGGRTIERHAVERGLIGKEIAIEKLIFGSDCPADEVYQHVERFTRIFNDLGLSDEEKDLLWYRNAAELFGLEEPLRAED